MFPEYTRGERLADLVVHLIGVPAGVVGGLVLVGLGVATGEPLQLLSLGLYAAGLMLMLSCSAAYNLVEAPALKARLRQVDHAAIFVMIAGTYTPFALLKIGGAAGAGLCGVVWTVALAGVVLKLRFPRRLERTSIALYLLLGWSIVPLIGPLLDSVPALALWLLLAGGIAYTLGVAFHLAERLRFHNAVWHALVLLAAALHYAAVLDAVALGA